MKIHLEYSQWGYHPLPRLRIEYDNETQTGECYARGHSMTREVLIELSQEVKNALTPKALNNFFKARTRREDNSPFLYITDMSSYSITMNAEDGRTRTVSGDSWRLERFLILDPLTKLSDSCDSLLNRCWEIDNEKVKQDEIAEGTELFSNNGLPIENPTIKDCLDLKDFWKYQYSYIWNMIPELAGFIVSRSLGIEKPKSQRFWTLWDIDYSDFRIEVKASSDFHPWLAEGTISKRNVFSIAKSRSNKFNLKEVPRRFSNVYVFCHNIGNSFENSYPLEIGNWEFYVVPTATIDRVCKDQKTISLSRIKKLTKSCKYDSLKEVIDNLTI